MGEHAAGGTRLASIFKLWINSYMSFGIGGTCREHGRSVDTRTSHMPACSRAQLAQKANTFGQRAVSMGLQRRPCRRRQNQLLSAVRAHGALLVSNAGLEAVAP